MRKRENLGYKMQDAGCRMQDAGCRMQDARCRACPVKRGLGLPRSGDARYKIQDENGLLIQP
jgi:hypothetical protein